MNLRWLLQLSSSALLLATASSFAATPDRPSPVVDVGETVTFLGGGLWKYEYTLTNVTSCVSDECFSNAPIYTFTIPAPDDAGVTDITAPAGWSFDSNLVTPDVYFPCVCQLPAVTWVAMSLADAIDVGEALAGFSYVAGFGPMKYPYWVTNAGFEFSEGDPSGPGSPIALANLPAAPVPEPGVYALMIAGLGLVGVTARRKRQGTRR